MAGSARVRVVGDRSNVDWVYWLAFESRLEPAFEIEASAFTGKGGNSAERLEVPPCLGLPMAMGSNSRSVDASTIILAG